MRSRSTIVLVQVAGIALALLLPIPATGQYDPFAGNEDVGSEGRFTIGLDLVPSPGGGSFFDGYGLLFGRRQDLDMALMPTLTGRIPITEHLDLALGTGWMSTELDEVVDAYSSDVFPVRDTAVIEPAAQIAERIELSAVPLTVGIEYSAVPSPYRSYVGLALGGALVTAEWTSDVNTFGGGGFARPATNERGPGFAPVARIYTGVDLTFDFARSERRLVRGVYIEAAWTWMPIGRDYFAEIRANGRGLPFVPEGDDATLDAGGFSIGIGAVISMQRGSTGEDEVP